MTRGAAFSLDGRTALVTGAVRGLGFEIARGLAAAGATVLINGRQRKSVDAAVARIVAEGGAALPYAFDVAKETAVARAMARIKREQGGLQILVNTVGQRDRRGFFDFDTQAVRRLLDVDLLAPFHLCQKAAPLMQADGYGRIINITSIAGIIARSGDAAYTTAKGGLAALTRALAAELGPLGITVNGIAPGYFATQANAAMAEDPSVAEWLSKRTSLGRWGEPAEIAGAAVFLASPAASYVTGQILAVDGGYLAHF